MAKLIVTRKKSFIGQAAKMSLWVNGKQVGSLSNGATVELDLPAGDKVFVCKFKKAFGLNSSKPMTLTIFDEDRKTINVAPSLAINLITAVVVGVAFGLADIFLLKDVKNQILRFGVLVGAVLAVYTIMGFILKDRYITVEEF